MIAEVATNDGSVMRRGRGRAPAHTLFKKGQSANPLGKPKGTQDKAAKAVRLVYDAIDRHDKGVAGFLDDLRERNPDLLFQMWCRLQPRETHTTVESRKLVVNIMQTAAPLAPVPQGDTKPILDVVPSSDTNAT